MGPQTCGRGPQAWGSVLPSETPGLLLHTILSSSITFILYFPSHGIWLG